MFAVVALLGGCGGGSGGAGPGPVAPTLSSTLPADGAVNVVTSTSLRFVFSAAMDQVTTEASISVLPEVARACSWNAVGTTVTCTPEAALAAGTLHTITIGGAARSAAGVNLAAARTIRFTTAAAGGGDPAPPGTPACTLGGAAALGACKLGS
jgi:hypothetical protein